MPRLALRVTGKLAPIAPPLSSMIASGRYASGAAPKPVSKFAPVTVAEPEGAAQHDERLKVLFAVPEF
jgi:hypothetical protein